jgi:ketosteroid isomerase-like protein
LIEWGDGSTSAATVSASGASFSISGNHTDVDQGSYTVRVWPPSAWDTQRAMSQQNVETVRQLSEAFSDGAKEWVEFYSPDVELHMRPRRSMDAAVYAGPDGMRRVVAEQAEEFDELRWDREILIDAGDRVVALFHRHGRGKDDGRPVDEQVAGVFSLQDGKVVRVQSYGSWSDALDSVRDYG